MPQSPPRPKLTRPLEPTLLPPTRRFHRAASNRPSPPRHTETKPQIHATLPAPTRTADAPPRPPPPAAHAPRPRNATAAPLQLSSPSPPTPPPPPALPPAWPWRDIAAVFSSCHSTRTA